MSWRQPGGARRVAVADGAPPETADVMASRIELGPDAAARTRSRCLGSTPASSACAGGRLAPIAFEPLQLSRRTIRVPPRGVAATRLPNPRGRAPASRRLVSSRRRLWPRAVFGLGASCPARICQRRRPRPRGRPSCASRRISSIGSRGLPSPSGARRPRSAWTARRPWFLCARRARGPPLAWTCLASPGTAPPLPRWVKAIDSTRS